MQRILIIEDNVASWVIMRMIFSKLGLEPRFERNALNGLRAARDWQPHYIVVDFMLPGVLDGLDIVTDLRGDETFDDTPIIACTVLTTHTDDVQMFVQLCDTSVSKPFTVHNWQQALHNASEVRADAHLGAGYNAS